MIGKKINQLATELAPVSTDLTIIGDPTTGVSKKITLAQLGAIFSGAVSFYTNLAGFPAVGDINVIYCAKDTQKLYLWSGSAYVEVFPSQALLDTYQLRSEKGNANGYASLDSGGKVPISQLPSSIMEYKGTWNASTNTPTLANGTGDTGDVYICNVAGTVNFGAGPLTFAVGDYVIYSGSIWQRSSGAVGTVTSVALTVGGDAISVSGSPLTTSGTLGLTFNGTTAQYIRGNGTLETFPTSLISGTGNVNAIPKFTANTVLGNSVMEDDGNFVSMRGLKLNLIAGTGNSINFQQASGIIAAGLGYSSIGAASSTGIKFYLDQNVTTRSFVLDTTTITSDTERTYSMPNSSGTLALTSDIPSLTGYVPYTGATANLDLGTHTLLAAKGTFSSSGSGDTVGITHSSGSGIALNITKGGNGEGLYINKTSGSGNAATIIGTLNATTLVKSGGTSSQFLKADGSVDSNTYLTTGTASSTYVPYTGASANVNLGANDLLSRSVYIEGTASFQAGLLMKQLSVYNFVTGAYTQIAPSTATELNIVHNQANTTRRRYALSVAALQDGDSFQYLVPRKDGTFAMTSDIPSLTGYVQGSGTTNYLPKFTGASTIGNSLVYDNGTNVGIGTTSPATKLEVYAASPSTVFDAHLTLQSSETTGAINTGGALQFSSHDGAALRTIASIRGLKENSTVGNYSGYISFSTRLNGASPSEKMRLDASGNLGLGVTPSAWSAGQAMQIGSLRGLSLFGGTAIAQIGNNVYYNGGYFYGATGTATLYTFDSGGHNWSIAPSGTAGNAISFTQAMTLDASGRLGIGTTSPSYKLQVNGASGTIARITDGTNNLDFYAGSSLNEIAATTSLLLSTNGATRLTIASTGAATFSSSVTAGGLLTTAYTSTGSSMGHFIVNTAASTLSNSSDIWFGTWGGSTISGITNARISALNVNAGNAATDLLFYTWNGSSSGERFRIASSGAATFSSSVDIGQSATVRGFAGTTGAGMFMAYGSAGAGIGSIYSYNYGTSTYGGTVIDGSYVAFYNSGSEKMRVTGGNVGIGTTSPSAKLHTQGTGAVFVAQSTDDSVPARVVNLSNGISTIGFQANGSANSFNVRVGCDVSDFIAYTNNTERMRITSGGSVLIGTSTEGFLGKLQVAGSVAITGQYNTVLPSSSFSYFDGSGQVVSSSSNASALYLDTTWNTTGNPDGIYLNVTNTASGASSKLLNLKVGSVSQFSVSKAGAIQTTAPSSGSAQPWKLGSYAAGGTGTATGVIYIEINGQIYSIPALQGTP
jgi:hypothetical protein